MDISPKIIVDELIPSLLKKVNNHLIIPDLIKVVSHKIETTDSTILMLNALMEEGIQNNMFFGQKLALERKVNCGLITSITTDYFEKMFKKWNDIGFIS